MNFAEYQPGDDAWKSPKKASVHTQYKQFRQNVMLALPLLSLLCGCLVWQITERQTSQEFSLGRSRQHSDMRSLLDIHVAARPAGRAPEAISAVPDARDLSVDTARRKETDAPRQATAYAKEKKRYSWVQMPSLSSLAAFAAVVQDGLLSASRGLISVFSGSLSEISQRALALLSSCPHMAAHRYNFHQRNAETPSSVPSLSAWTFASEMLENLWYPEFTLLELSQYTGDTSCASIANEDLVVVGVRDTLEDLDEDKSYFKWSAICTPEKAIYLGIGGDVFDVTASAGFYGPSGPYRVFSGRDSTRALTLGVLDQDDVESRDLSDFGPREWELLEQQHAFYKNKYPKVGWYKLQGMESTVDEKEAK